MYYSNKQPKNDNYKPKRDDYGYVPRERGGCLTIFLVVLLIYNGLECLLFTNQFSELTAFRRVNFPPLLSFLLIVFKVGVVVCIVGMWNWQNWGFIGMLLLYGVAIVLYVLAGYLWMVGGAVVGAGILYYLVNERSEMFE